MTIYKVSLFTGHGNKTKIAGIYSAPTPHNAAKKFLTDRIPGAELFPLRHEHPTIKNDVVFSEWSAGTTASGQRIYIEEHGGLSLDEIKQAIADSKSVYWSNDSYQVLQDRTGQYQIRFDLDGHCIGLTHKDGVTLNGKEAEFFIL